MKILLTGASGQVGHALAARLHGHELVTPARTELDLAATDTIDAYIGRIGPDLIINPAAYTAVDKAQSEPELARLLNVEAPLALAQAATRRGVALIHFSTDYVFDGTKDAPYDEHDAPCPLSVYGSSKLEGEQAVMQACNHAWILRTSWVYGAHGGNFMKTILRLAQERKTLSIVGDQWGAPTWSFTIADAVLQMMDGFTSAEALAQRVCESAGLYHLTARGATNWHDYAAHVVDAMPSLGLSPKLASADIAAIATEAYPTAARRPKNSRLRTDKLEQTFGLRLPEWDIALDQCLRGMVQQP